MIVETVTLRDFRSYERLDLSLEPGLVLVTGANGAGKTNLLESLHVGTQGFSPRTRSDTQLVRLGAGASRVELQGSRSGAGCVVRVDLSPDQGKRAFLNGTRLPAAEQLRREMHTLVFTPERVAVVKGGPAVRRAYFDRALARLVPARSQLPAEYAAAVGQRNAALRGTASGYAPAESVQPWTEQVVRLGADLVAARRETLLALGPAFAQLAASLGLSAAELVYEGEAPSLRELDARLERDLERGTTGAGPHLHDVAIRSADHDLRSYGSQGEQRLAVLALLLGEARALEERTGRLPLLLLDDVLSELDLQRRTTLAGLLPEGQAVLTTTSREALPGLPDQLLEVRPGEAEAR